MHERTRRFMLGNMGLRKIGVVLLALSLAGILVSASGAAPPDPKKMVLRLADLPAGFTLDKAYYDNNAQAAKKSSGRTSVAQYTSWGRITGYSTDYSRSAIAGIISITSDANTYKTAKGAADSTHHSYKGLAKPQKIDGKTIVFKQVSIGAKVGHEARMYTATITEQGIAVIAYMIGWRFGPVNAAVTVIGMNGTVDAADAVKLAKKQQARIAAATS